MKLETQYKQRLSDPTTSHYGVIHVTARYIIYAIGFVVLSESMAIL